MSKVEYKDIIAFHPGYYVKDVIDDVDGYDGIVFNRWYADMCRKGVQVDWYDCR